MPFLFSTFFTSCSHWNECIQKIVTKLLPLPFSGCVGEWQHERQLCLDKTTCGIRLKVSGIFSYCLSQLLSVLCASHQTTSYPTLVSDSIVFSLFPVVVPEKGGDHIHFSSWQTFPVYFRSAQVINARTTLCILLMVYHYSASSLFQQLSCSHLIVFSFCARAFLKILFCFREMDGELPDCLRNNNHWYIYTLLTSTWTKLWVCFRCLNRKFFYNCI